MWHLTVPVKSREAQLQAMHSSKRIELERDFGGNESAVEFYEASSMLQRRFRTLIGFESPRRAFQCPVAAEHARALHMRTWLNMKLLTARSAFHRTIARYACG